MKIPANLNAIGLNTPEKLVPYLANLLLAGTLPSPVAVELKAKIPKGSITPANPTAVPPVVANPPADIPAVMSKVVKPDPAYLGAVAIDDSNESYTKIMAALAYSPSAAASGKAVESCLGEITPKLLDLGNYYGDVSATDTDYPNLANKTVEQLFYEQIALLAAVDGHENKAEVGTYRSTPVAPPVPVIMVECYVGKQEELPGNLAG